MKITALVVLKASGAGDSSSSGASDPVVLANASDVSHFGFFQRSAAKEFILFVGRTVAKRTPPGQRQSVQHEEYKVHSYNRNGLVAIAFMDDHYPVRSAFSLLNKTDILSRHQLRPGCDTKISDISAETANHMFMLKNTSRRGLSLDEMLRCRTSRRLNLDEMLRCWTSLPRCPTSRPRRRTMVPC